jgi:hypothetical protein
MNWPNDADGDVLRSLHESGFDFSKATLIDFNVDFRSWPPPPEAVALLSREYPSLKVYAPEDSGDGYLQFQVYALATYELVTNVQAHVTELMVPFKGECDSWGILHDPNSN